MSAAPGSARPASEGYDASAAAASWQADYSPGRGSLHTSQRIPEIQLSQLSADEEVRRAPHPHATVHWLQAVTTHGTLAVKQYPALVTRTRPHEYKGRSKLGGHMLLAALSC